MLLSLRVSLASRLCVKHNGPHSGPYGLRMWAISPSNRYVAGLARVQKDQHCPRISSEFLRIQLPVRCFIVRLENWQNDLIVLASNGLHRVAFEAVGGSLRLCDKPWTSAHRLIGWNNNSGSMPIIHYQPERDSVRFELSPLQIVMPQ